MSFRKYHLIHHKHQGDVELDADLPFEAEAVFVGQGFFKKAFWLFMFSFVEGAVRPGRLKKIKLFDKWVFINLAIMIVFAASLILVAGWQAYFYLILSTFFSVGLHPMGARWIQEHFVIVKEQETYSYYGNLNKLSFNVGYHNEHHDLMLVPWSKLPQVRKIAAEYYDTLYYHHSWLKLLGTFLFKKDITLFSRVIRKPKIQSSAPSLGKAVEDTFSITELASPEILG